MIKKKGFKKGQILSIDFLVASVIMIIFLGVIISSTETKMLENKEQLDFQKDKLLFESALISISNGKYSCDFNGVNLSYSIDESKINIPEIKDYLGLNDYNLFIKIGNNTIINEEMNGDVFAKDLNIFLCNAITKSELMDCYNNGCNNKKILRLKISG